MATHLTGRHFKLDLFPFSFQEFLKLEKINTDFSIYDQKALLLRFFDKYLENGGFPEFLKYRDPELLKRNYEDILYKDLLVRFKIKETKQFKQLASWLFANFAKETSYHSLKKILGFKSATSVKNYVDFMEESFLLFELYKYDFSLKKQFVSNKKIYVIDNGLRNNVAFYFSEDKGRLLENIVFLELKRRGKEIYYYKNKNECDFLIKDGARVNELIQVSFELNQNKERELAGLMEAMEKFELDDGLLLTKDEEDQVEIGRKKIKVFPVWKWLLKNPVR